LGDKSVDGRTIPMLKGIEYECEDLNQLAQEAVQWRAPMNTVINFKVPERMRIEFNR
jgi:hypothetical protein